MHVTYGRILKITPRSLCLFIGAVTLGVIIARNLCAPQKFSERTRISSQVSSIDKIREENGRQSVDIDNTVIEMNNLRRTQSKLRRNVKTLDSTLGTLRKEQHPLNNRSVEPGDYGNDGEESDAESMIEDIHKIEPIDSVWSGSATDALYNSLDYSLHKGVKLLNVDCRTSICRAEFSFDGESFDEATTALQDSIPWDASVFIEIDDVGSGEATVYITRTD